MSNLRLARDGSNAIWLQVTLLILASVVAPVTLLSPRVEAGQLQSRSVEITDSSAGATANYTFTWTPENTTSAIQGIKLQACDTALGTCNAPTGFDISSATFSSQTGFPTNGTSFVKGAGAGGCTASASVACLNRTQAGNDTATAHTLVINSVVNPSDDGLGTTTAQTFFIRITNYSDNGYTTATDDGTVATAVIDRLTVTARVEEILEFCLGTDTDAASGEDCTNMDDVTTVNLGTLNTSTVTTAQGSAMLRSNASQGTVIKYRSNSVDGTATADGELKVVGASVSCTGTQLDRCINSSSTESAISNGQANEEFGMRVSNIDTDAGSTTNLAATGEYDGTGYAWNDGGTAMTPESIATSAGAGTKVVDDEMLELTFAAIAAITTPTGIYQTSAELIAVPTY